VLAELKHDAAFRRIPVVIQTTSKDSDDITRSYDLHANSYVTKPVSLKEFLSMVHFLQEYWFSIVTLPTE
jgi:two-component system, chemotaxis family, response regulator Rcp1